VKNKTPPKTRKN